MDRRGFLLLTGGTVAAGLFGSLGGCGSDLPLKIAAQAAWPGYAPLYLAQKQGWLSESDVTLIKTPSLGASSAMLANGEADAAAITLDEALHIIDQGVPLSVVAILDISAGGDAVLARPEITTLADLKGKKIGVENSSLGTIMLTKLLEAANMRRSDVEIVTIASDHMQSLEQLDAIITYEPNPTLLKSRGYVRLFDSRSLPNMIVDLLAVRADREKNHAGALHNAVNAHFRALALWQQNPIDAAYLLAPILGTPPEDVKKSFYGLNLPDVSYNQHYLAAPAQELNQSAKDISGILLRAGQMKGTPDVSRLFTADYLPETP